MRNISGHNAIINSIAVNKDNVLVSSADNGKNNTIFKTMSLGSMFFWDYKTGYNFQQFQGVPQPGSIAAENGIFCCAFDQSQMRLITGECDKTIKMYKEDEEATPETHPIEDFKLEFQTQKF
jgi:pleiotropic regulator 1